MNDDLMGEKIKQKQSSTEEIRKALEAAAAKKYPEHLFKRPRKEVDKVVKSLTEFDERHGGILMFVDGAEGGATIYRDGTVISSRGEGIMTDHGVVYTQPSPFAPRTDHLGKPAKLYHLKKTARDKRTELKHEKG